MKDPKLTAYEKAAAEAARTKNGQVDKQFLQSLKGYSITTAEILYRMPDHPSLLQTYVWQDYDIHPRFPKLTGFLNFWSQNLDGPLFKVRVAHSQLIRPSEINFLDAQFKIGHGLN